MTGVLIRRKRFQDCRLTEKRPCEDTVRRQPFANQGEKPKEKPTLLQP